MNCNIHDSHAIYDVNLPWVSNDVLVLAFLQSVLHLMVYLCRFLICVHAGTPNASAGAVAAGDQVDGHQVEGVSAATFRRGMRNKQSLSGLAGDMDMY